MSTASIRVSLRGLSDEEWQEILDTSHLFALHIEPGGTRPGHVTVAELRRWLQMPKKSDPVLPHALDWTGRWYIDLTNDEEVEEFELLEYPQEIQEVRDWLVRVASKYGQGPAKLCLLAHQAHHGRSAAAGRHHTELLALIESTTHTSDADDTAEEAVEQHSQEPADEGGSASTEAVLGETGDVDREDLWRGVEPLRDEPAPKGDTVEATPEDSEKAGPEVREVTPTGTRRDGGESETSVAPPHALGSDRGRQDWSAAADRLSQEVDELRSVGQALAVGLRDLATEIEVGANPNSSVVEALESYKARFRALLEDVAELTGLRGSTDNVGDIAQALSSWISAQREQARAAEIADLEAELEHIDRTLPEATPRMAAGLRAMRSDIIKQLEELKSREGLGPEQSVPAAAEAGEPRPGPKQDDAGGARSETSSEAPALVPPPGEASVDEGESTLEVTDAADGGSDQEPSQPAHELTREPVSRDRTRQGGDSQVPAPASADAATGSGSPHPVEQEAAGVELPPPPKARGKERGEAAPSPAGARPSRGSEREEQERSAELREGDGLLLQPLAELISQGRPAAAWWVAHAHSPEAPFTRALRFYAVSFASGAGSVSPGDALLDGADLEPESFVEDRGAAIAVLTGAARASLAAGWMHPPLLEGLLATLSLDSRWHRLFEVITEALHRGYVHLNPLTVTELPSRQDLARRARTLASELSSSTICYQRGTRVLQYLLRRDQALGSALSVVEAWATSDAENVAELQSAASALSAGRRRQRLIDDADKAIASAKQRREPIIAAARTQLERSIDEVADLVGRSLELAAAPNKGTSDLAIRRQLEEMAGALTPPDTESDLNGSLLANLTAWILQPHGRWPEAGADVRDLLVRASLPLTDFLRDEEGVPQVAGQMQRVVPLLLGQQRDAELVAAYIKAGNLSAAVLSAADESLQDKVDSAAEMWGAKLKRMHRRVDEDFARARAEQKMEPNTIADIEGRLQQVATYDGDRYDLMVQSLEAITRELNRSFEDEASRLLEAIAGIEPETTPQNVERLRYLVEAKDLTTAREYLYFLREGHDLPTPRQETTTPLEDFQQVATKLTAQTDLPGILDAFGGLPNGDPIADAGTRAWTVLQKNPAHPAPDTLWSVLRLLGLERRDRTQPIKDVTRPGAAGARTVAVRAIPRDGSIVPGLGSRAAQYYVTVVPHHERTDPEQVLRLIPEDRIQDANLILIPRTLTERERRNFLLAARKRRVTAIFIDNTVAAFMAARSAGSFKDLQQITLPFAAFSHYTPFVAGDVPDEVFVGRVVEREQIIDPAGSLFVYGGRQLGKSALLRRIARTFTRQPDRYAVYVDLKAKMIGEARDPAHLWPVLLAEFKSVGIIGPRISSGTAKTVTEHVRSWLEEDPTRRILLLLDEADLFLESEAQQRREANRIVQFANLQPLKDLMESTGRRFKPVFAGLHQVQRFQNISNTPLAHGGRDILIGPLERDAAMELVEAPMSALGYRFESRDLIFRLLAFTNYQASLVQIVCDQLVTHMGGRPPAVGQPPVTITSDDVDRVTEDPAVRKHLAERFRLTIALEDRYLVIALVMAVLSLEDKFTRSYDPVDVLEWCREYWPGGFNGMTTQEFNLYLEEMEGLGVLVRRGTDQVAVRSPNVVAMLGTQAELTKELEEGADRFQLPHGFNPRVSRRRIKHQGKDLRSPLTEEDLRILLHPSAPGGVYLVVGSPATGNDDVVPALQSVAAERDIDLQVVDPESFPGWITESSAASRSQTRRLTPVVTAAHLSAPACEDIVTRAFRMAERRREQRVIIQMGPDSVELLDTWGTRATLVYLNRWNDDGLRSWGEGPFSPAGHRAETLAATSGWPKLVHEVAERSMSGVPWHDVIEAAQRFPRTSQESTEFLRAVGAEPHIDSLRAWTSFTEPGEAVDTDVLADLLAEEDAAIASTIDPMVQRLTKLGVVTGEAPAQVLDPVVHRAVLALAR